MKRVVIVNAGGQGQLFAEAGDYDKLVKFLAKAVGEMEGGNSPREKYATVEVVTSVAALVTYLINNTDVLIFMSGDMLNTATQIQKAHPKLKVVVLTGRYPENQVIIVDRRWISLEFLLKLIRG